MRRSSWLRSAGSLFSTSRAVSGHRVKRTSKTRLFIEPLEDRAVLSTFTVLNLADAGAGSLRQAILDANANPGADLVQFGSAANNGTITLMSGQLSITDDLQIDGPGADCLAVSGNDSSRVFQIPSGVVVDIDDLTITQGRATGQGGGILTAGSLTLTRTILADNTVVGVPNANVAAVVDAFGGGILNTGVLTVRHSRFVNNQALGGDGDSGTIGTSALGGAIRSVGSLGAPSTAVVSDSVFVGNRAVGGAAGAGASRAGLGGAIHNDSGSFTVSRSLFRDNEAVGGLTSAIPGGFGAGSGGAIANVARIGDATLSVDDSTLTNNRAIGGAAGTGGVAQNGRGGAIANFLFGGLTPPVTVTATAAVNHSSLLGNQAIGGAGPTGGTGQGGGIANLLGGVLSVSSSMIALNGAVGGAGDGGNGGNGHGGGIFNGGPSPVGTPSLTLSRSLVTLNWSNGGASNGGTAGQGIGGGLYIATDGIATADFFTVIFANDASTSDDQVFGVLKRKKP